MLTGCSVSKSDSIEEFKKHNNKITSYELTGDMEIISNEDVFTYNMKVQVLNQKYYKVSLTNTINEHEQIILKNEDGVYVITPDANKSFKFTSNWPNNSSQAYLIESLLSDILKDTGSKIEEIPDGYRIISKVNYPNNNKLISEEIITDNKYNIKKVNVLDKDNNRVLTVKINDYDYNPKLTKDDFKIEEKEIEIDDKKCQGENCTEETSNILEDIIYPLYVPANTYLQSKDTVSTSDGNRVILTFAGSDPFIIVEEVSKINSELEIIPVNGNPMMLGGTIGAYSDNSLYFTTGGVDFYITSNTLSGNEMMTIAESIQNSTTLVASTK